MRGFVMSWLPISRCYNESYIFCEGMKKKIYFAKESKRKYRGYFSLIVFIYIYIYFFLNHLQNTWNRKWFFRRRQGDNKWAESQERFLFVLDFFFVFQYNQKGVLWGVGKMGEKDIYPAPARYWGLFNVIFFFFHSKNRHLEITSRERRYDPYSNVITSQLFKVKFISTHHTQLFLNDYFKMIWRCEMNLIGWTQ